jgi:hypothetical protein
VDWPLQVTTPQRAPLDVQVPTNGLLQLTIVPWTQL